MSVPLSFSSFSSFSSLWAFFCSLTFGFTVLGHFLFPESPFTFVLQYLYLGLTLSFFLFYLFRSSSALFQLALLTYLEAIRNKFFIVIVLFTLGTLSYGLFSQSVIPRDQLKLLQKMCLTTSTLFGALTAIFFSSSLIPKEIKDRTVYSLLAKPIRRFEYLLGRLLGCWMLLALLVFLMLCISLLLLEWTLWQMGQTNPILQEDLAIARKPYRTEKVCYGNHKELLFCERCFQVVSASLQICQKKGEHQEFLHCRRPQPLTQIQEKAKAEGVVLRIPLQEELIFVFENLPPSLFQRSTLPEDERRSPLRLQFYPSQATYVKSVPFLFEFQNPQTQEKIQKKIYVPPDREYWDYFPTRCIDAQGQLWIKVTRLHPHLSEVTFNSLLVCGSSGRVEKLFIKAFFLLYLKLILLSLLALMCSTFLTTPVAVLFSSFLFFLGNMIEFLEDFVETLQSSHRMTLLKQLYPLGTPNLAETPLLLEEQGGLSQLLLDSLLRGIEVFCNYFINFTSFDVGHLLQIGVDFPFSLLGDRFLYFLLYAFPLLALSYLCFQYRELH
jgi:hypothetical protein